LPSVAAMTFIGAYGIEFSNTAWAILIIVVILVYVIGRYIILQIERQHEIHLNENALVDSDSHHAN